METIDLSTAEGLTQWLTEAVAEKLNVSPESIDINIPFDEYALESVAAVSISGDLGEELGRDLTGTLLYEYPTIAELSEHLMESA